MQAESIIYPPRAIYLASCRSVGLEDYLIQNLGVDGFV